MSRVIGTRRATSDHFEPDDEVDPKLQRQLRGHLEQIDYAAYAANKKVLGATLGAVDAERFPDVGFDRRVGVGGEGAHRAASVRALRWARTEWAALWPGAPVTSPPGWVPAPQR